jgi:hypothetical protein
MEVKLTGTRQLLVCADDVNLLGDNMNIIEKHFDASNELGLELKGSKIKLSLHLTK